ncbi:MAG: ATP-binding cassette domain-containing protein [Perlabentimonas sp.]
MLNIQNLNKEYGEFSLKSINLNVKQGEYFILLGPSGAGKSVVLELIAGFIKPDSGTIMLNERDITHLNIQNRSVGLVFQDLALFPHLSVRQNISYPLQRKGLSKHEINRRVIELANNLSISHLLRRFPPTLSGGEQQRVALARTLALQPNILLLDEPLSSLDVERKAEIRKLLREINRQGQTIVHVTHDYEEAIALANRIAVMHNGEIEQTGTPQEVFSKPASSFVAGFGGIRNFFEVNVNPSEHSGLAKAQVTTKLNIYLLGNHMGNGYVTFPENAVSVSKSPSNSSAQNCFKGQVIDLYPQRYGIELVVDIGVKVYSLITDESLQKLGISIGTEVWVSFKASSVRFINRE